MKELAQKLNWDVEIQSIQIPGREESNRYALLRSDDKSLIGIRSDRYHPVYNSDMELIKERVLETEGFSFKGYEEFQNGKRILAFFENKRKDLQLCGQDVKDYLIIGNSHDTSSKLFVGTSNFMYRCENQFTEKIRTIEHKHNRIFDIDKLQINEIIQTYELGRRNLYGKMERLKQTEANMGLIQHLAITLLGSEQKNDRLEVNQSLKNNERTIQLLHCIETEILDLGPTLWGVFNGVTRYTSNHLKGKQGFGVVNGLGERMNREALNLLNQNIN